MMQAMAVLFVAVLQAMLPFTDVARGSNSRIDEPRQVVIRSIDEWRTLWKEHGAAALPVVDFSKSMVVGVFIGSRPTAGYRVDIVGVRKEGATVVVEYRETAPAPDAMVAQMLTSPFHLVSLPRTDGTFQFRKLAPANP